MIGIIDYGAGNLKSVINAFASLGTDVGVICREKELERCSGLVLPGVGAFPAAMRRLNDSGLVEPLKDAVSNGVPLLGVCLGMQMLFESSSEFETTEGLGLLEGSIRPINGGGLPIPHMGWNSLRLNFETPVLGAEGEGRYVYFVHSFMADCPKDEVAAYTDYGEPVPALVNRGKVFGAQFHPEKSSDFGIEILRKFCSFC